MRTLLTDRDVNPLDVAEFFMKAVADAHMSKMRDVSFELHCRHLLNS